MLEGWKTAYIVLVYKKGSKEDLGTYRLVSFNISDYKNLQKVTEKLYKHLDNNKIPYESQYLFKIKILIYSNFKEKDKISFTNIFIIRLLPYQCK